MAAISTHFPSGRDGCSPGPTERLVRVAIPHGDGDPAVAGPVVDIDPGSRIVVARGNPVALTRLEFDLLLHLSRHSGRVCRREALLDEVWGLPKASRHRSRTLDVHIRKLRTKLGADLPLITTVRGVGYRLDGSDLVRLHGN
ncbi:winged helix-turn-helix transcriptional regulator [Prauserella sp. ASG 168]|uniref:Winged helix-turn-helix transcriptional regulator n=1 Tax=Prauserella cavernicola TaxID=2800127 RepID=A0A934V460_9PSEU|nr:winged helix-turn-helix transcriptional regulator [Prauserella cavernicola]